MGAVFPHIEEDNEVSSARPERLGCGRPGQRGCLPQVGEGAGQAVQDQGRVDHEAGHLHEELQQDGGAQQGLRCRQGDLGPRGEPVVRPYHGGVEGRDGNRNVRKHGGAEHNQVDPPSKTQWRSHGIVSPVKDQKHCGSCAAFTTVAIVESCFAQQTGVITDLSEEHLVNCMATNGCSGWYTNQYLDDLVSSNGGRLEQEYCCSYTATDGHCSDDNSCDYTSASVTGHYISWYAKETEMAAHVAATGPAGTTIFADYLFDYSYGIFEDPRCCEETTDPNCRKEH